MIKPNINSTDFVQDVGVHEYWKASFLKQHNPKGTKIIKVHSKYYLISSVHFYRKMGIIRPLQISENEVMRLSQASMMPIEYKKSFNSCLKNINKSDVLMMTNNRFEDDPFYREIKYFDDGVFKSIVGHHQHIAFVDVFETAIKGLFVFNWHH